MRIGVRNFAGAALMLFAAAMAVCNWYEDRTWARALLVALCLTGRLRTA